MSEDTTGGAVADHGDGAEFSTILVDRPEQAPRVGLITLHRPEALNALNTTLMHEVVAAATAMDADPGIGAIVLTGSRKAFAAGADIKEMRDKTYPQTYTEDLFGGWDALTRLRTPLIAAVSGYALGGGCELAMLCDVVLASDTAVFGQPEIKLGVIPGIGGSQRLTRAVGKAKAMELVLTGRNMPAEEAERCGLVARVVPVDDLLDDALATAATIASYPATAVAMAKEVVDAAFETPLAQGLQLERRVFHAVFGTPDQREGMTAFLEKRPARFHEA